MPPADSLAADSLAAEDRQLLTLLCCVEAIDRRLQDCRPEDRWHWTSRRNAALFLLNRLADSAAGRGIPVSVRQLSAAEREAIAAQHSLLAPLDLSRSATEPRR